MTPFWLRIALTIVLSMLFGMARQRARKPIGFGTFTLVATGACGLAISATLLARENPLPLLGAIITGIGFLGAGALVRTSDRIFGFTSAAAIWLFAIIGLVFGIGETWLGLTLYGVAWLVIGVDFLLIRYGIGSYQRKLVIVASAGVSDTEVERVVAGGTQYWKLTALAHNRPQSSATFTYIVENKKEAMVSLVKRLAECDWVLTCSIE